MKPLANKFILAMLGALAGVQPALGQDAQAEAAATLSLSPAQLFEFADAARARGDFVTAETAYRALAGNPDPELRAEARFRLGMMLADDLHKYRDAATQFRALLDDKPDAARVRLELARMRALMGEVGAAERELRAAEATGLPAEVQQLVRFYANALSQAKPFGYSLELALAPDTNINRATRSDTLGTVIGDFTLDSDARARSGLGLALRGQGFARIGINKQARLLLQANGQGNLYRDDQFNDIIASLQAGPEFALGRDRLNLGGQVAWRWYGGKPYSLSRGANVAFQHPLGKRAQLRLSGAVADENNRVNALQDATIYRLAVDYDRAFSSRSGGGVQVSATRGSARDPGYSTTSGGLNAYLFREFPIGTAVLNLGYSHLEADRRLFLYPDRRIDDRFTFGLGMTLRKLRVGHFAPLARFGFERNLSNIELYDYRRFAGELGITGAF